MPSMILYTYLSWTGPRDRRYFLLQIAFTCSWIGDTLIALPKTYTIFLFLGGWSFFFQHIFYIWLNLASKGAQSKAWKTPYWGLPSAAYIAMFSVSYWSQGNFTDKLQYGLYSFTLGISFSSSFYCELKRRSNYWIRILGFAVFVISDVIIMVDNFIYTMTDLQASSILVTYYVAQSLICYSHLDEAKATLEAA